MDIPTLQIKRRRKIALLTENRSRMGEASLMLAPYDIPKDGLSRVFVGETLEGLYTAAPLPSYRSLVQVCAEVIKHISKDAGQVWCFGETSLRIMDLMRPWIGSVLHSCPAAVRDQFFIFPLNNLQIENILPWPDLRDDHSLHIFVVKDQMNSFNAMLQELYVNTATDPLRATATFLDLVKRCAARSTLLSLLQEVSVIMLPEGPHSEFACLHSTTYEAEAIVSEFSAVATNYGYVLETLINDDDTYAEFFRDANDIIIVT